MNDYKQQRASTARSSTLFGVVIAVVAHLFLIGYGTFSGIKYLYPPPEEQSFLIDFSEQEPRPIVQQRRGTEPTMEEIDPTKPLELVQRSESPIQGKKANKAPEAQIDDHGDVEVPDPPKEKEIDRRALFRAADNDTDKDTLAPQTASKVSEALKAGHASGNTQAGKQTGEPSARLKGRNVVGALPAPKYNVQAEGTVVVTVWVDQYGNVQKANPGAEGTTVTNSNLFAAARAAAMAAHFNVDGKAPALQEGTITYIFTLR